MTHHYHCSKRTPFITSGRAVLLALAVLALAVPSQAHDIDCTTSTVQVSSSNFSLQHNYFTTSATNPCFDVRNGKNVDLKGFHIKCTSNTDCFMAIDCSQDAVEGSTIQSTINNDADFINIEGSFTTGVNECQIVKNLVIEGSSTAVFNNAKKLTKVQGMVIRDCADTCVDVKIEADANSVNNNFIDAQGGVAVQIIGKSSGNGPKVDHNVITGFSTGIANLDSTNFRVQKNVLYSGEAGSVSIGIGSGGTATDNVCEDDDSDCACDLFFEDRGATCLAP